MSKSGFTIESNVPAPSGGCRKSKYPWHDMKVNDSVLFDANEVDRALLARRLLNAARSHISYHRRDLRVIVRSNDDGVRVWFVPRNTNDTEGSAE